MVSAAPELPFWLGGSTLTGFNNRLYPSLNSNSAPFGVDGSGISLLLANGVQVVLQYNATSNLLQTIDTATGLTSGTVTTFNVLPWSNTNSTLAACTTTLQPLPSTAPVTCPAGTSVLHFGDLTTSDIIQMIDQDVLAEPSWVYTRGFNASIGGMTLYQLSLRINDNPFLLLSLRLGVYTLFNSTISDPVAG